PWLAVPHQLFLEFRWTGLPRRVGRLFIRIEIYAVTGMWHFHILGYLLPYIRKM
ncbi:hypothetical protein TWF569_002573, partial [Orbilia oligospora]